LTNLFETQAFNRVGSGSILPSHRSVVPHLVPRCVHRTPGVLICLAALILPVEWCNRNPQCAARGLSFHAAIAILASGAFALAFVTGAMYLTRNGNSSGGSSSSSFLLLPSIEQLELIPLPLLIMGFSMLTVGMIGGLVSYHNRPTLDDAEIIWAVSVWILYGALVLARGLWTLREEGRDGVDDVVRVHARRLLGSEPSLTMNLIVIGLNHRSAPVEVRERLAFAEGRLGEATRALLNARSCMSGNSSTCNALRSTVWPITPLRPHRRPRRFLHDHHNWLIQVDVYLYEHHDHESSSIPEVACGLDSMVLGETEILGQVKMPTTPPNKRVPLVLSSTVFPKSFLCAETHPLPDRHHTRFHLRRHCGRDLAEKIFGKLGKCTVMVIGTGE